LQTWPPILSPPHKRNDGRDSNQTIETINTFHVQPSLPNISGTTAELFGFVTSPRRPRRVRHAVHGALRTADTLKAIQ
jgi:hypothetical protein